MSFTADRYSEHERYGQFIIALKFNYNKYANNKELAAIVAVQHRQTLIMSKCS